MIILQTLVLILAILVLLLSVWKKQVPKGILEWLIIMGAVLILIGKVRW